MQVAGINARAHSPALRLPALAAVRTVAGPVSYFDHNATTPLAPVARAAWLRAQDESWANPSALYRDAARVQIRLESARGQLATLLGSDPARFVWTGGATEAAGAVIAHLARSAPADARLALSPIEHPCVIEAARAAWGEERLAWLPVDADGVVRLDGPGGVRELLAPERADAASSSVPAEITRARPAAIVVMAANNETGVLQPWPEIARLARAAGVASVCDASQWLGKLPAAGLGAVDWVFGAAHKFGGPKGAGFLQVPLGGGAGFTAARGGAQQRGLRAGTEDYPAVAAMLAALAEAETTKMFLETERLRWRDAFIAGVTAALPGTRVIGAGAERLWNTVSLLLPHGDATRWVARLDRRGIQISTGAACATGKTGPSHVLAALGLAPDEGRRVVRVSSGWATTEDDWRALAEAFAAVAPEVVPGDVVVNLPAR